MPEKLKKALKITGITVLVFFVLFNIWAFVGVPYLVNNGYMTKFEGKWYTRQQLKETFPPQYVDAPAKNTPEEVYTAFRESLVRGDLEGALGLIVEEKKDDYRKVFEATGAMSKWADKYPEKINKRSVNGNFAIYDADMGTKNENTVDFLKNGDGYWEIDAI